VTGLDAALLPAVLLADVMIPSQVLTTRTFYVHVQARCPAWCKAKKSHLNSTCASRGLNVWQGRLHVRHGFALAATCKTQ
jgi:hypothetical protein